MISVAIIEDEISILETLAELIRADREIECVWTYTTAEEAIEKIPGISPDVVLVDIHLPGKNGIECIRELKPECPGVQFLMCTSFEDSDWVFSALKAGATGYITKTTRPSVLLDAIKDVFRGGSPMSSNIARKVVASFQEKEKENREFGKLTRREQEILQLLSMGLRYKEIAGQLFLSTETVRTHIRNIYEKLHVNSRTEAINKALGKG